MLNILSMLYKKHSIGLLLIFLLTFSLGCNSLGGDSGNTPPTSPDNNNPDSSATSDPAVIIDEIATGEATPPTVQEPKPTSNAKLSENQNLILSGGLPPTFDPHLSGDSTSAEYVVEIFSGLMAYDPDLNLVYDLAESYDISEDGLVYSFKIRNNAKFQDGKPIRANDFKWSFERACDPATGSHTADTYLGDIVGCRDKLEGNADEISGVVVLDDFTIEITIDEPKAFFLAKMSYPTAYVLDRENVESGGDRWFLHPNGSGPFRLEEVNIEQGVIILAKNENYYREPQPTLERVIYLLSAVSGMQGYEEGLPDNILQALDLPSNATFDAVPVSNINLEQATDPNNPLSKEFVSVNSMSVNYLGFNVNKPPFDELKIRQAFNLALDKRRMVKLTSKNTTPVANGIVPPNMPGYENPDLSDYEFDPERALSLIAESSYGDVSELPEITLNVSGSGGNVSQLVQAVVDSYETNLGIKVAVVQAAWPDFLDDLNQQDIPYQMYQLGWIADYPDPQNFLEILFHSDSLQNHGNYSNPEVDTLLNQARGIQDVKERLAVYQQVEQLILDDAAWVPLSFSVNNWLVKPYVQNFNIPPMAVPQYQYVSIAEH